MDLKQRKLSKSEWESIEIPVSSGEIEILKLISSGYDNINIKFNKTESLNAFLKIEYSEKMEHYLYKIYFSEKIDEMLRLYRIDGIELNIDSKIIIKKADQIRLSKNVSISEMKDDIYETVLINQLDSLFRYKQQNNKKWLYYYFTLYKLIRNNIFLLNQFVKNLVIFVIKKYEEEVDLLHIVCNSNEYIEKNSCLLKYGDMTLYDHQKEIFAVSKMPGPKLILYIAPTGTGKTLTPLGLSEKNKIIFVCAARHVGLALARSAISINKKVAFAFGCNSAEDVRLHYFSAKEYSVNKKSGGIGKVDNTIGDKVEIIICDIKSYLYAMYYMLAFNEASTIITYWDEPTITLDYANHEFHEIIKKNWTDNLIPNFVLSSATLPKIHEINETIIDFKEKFPSAVISNIVSHDCRKTIPIINNCGYIVMPHYLNDDYDKVIEIANHCENNLTLLRYFDLQECSNFIYFCENNKYLRITATMNKNFASIDDIDMKSIKKHYLKVIKNIIPGTWGAIYISFKITRSKRIITNSTIDLKGHKIKKSQSIGPGVHISSHSGEPLVRLQSEQIPHISVEDSGVCAMYITTKDAYTLTDGPAIFLASDVQKIAKFCIQQANIPTVVMSDIIEKIEYNNNINEKIILLEKEMETELEKNANKEEKNDVGIKKTNKDGKNKSKNIHDKMGKTKDKKVIQLQEQVVMCRSMIQRASLNEIFIPNKLAHMEKWAEGLYTKASFTSNIEDDIVVSIMLLKNVEDSWKILLLLGIGVFTNHESSEYTEIMKKLADQQKLYMIIADSDYIYGTNYQFCHGYLSKDLKLTQEKIIQAMGRIGRNNIQQEYSVRFRDDEQIKILFTAFKSEDKPEVINMNLLFNSKNINWNPETKQFDL